MGDLHDAFRDHGALIRLVETLSGDVHISKSYAVEAGKTYDAVFVASVAPPPPAGTFVWFISQCPYSAPGISLVGASLLQGARPRVPSHSSPPPHLTSSEPSRDVIDLQTFWEKMWSLEPVMEAVV